MSISHTAWLVMLCQIALFRNPRWRALVEEEDARFYQACFDYCRRASPLYRIVSLIPERPHLWLIDNALVKGAPQHYVLRKQAIKKQAMECIKNGVTQMVVIGGGFDPLALRVAQQNPTMRCFEIDRPSMHAHKIEAALAHYGTLPPNFFGIGEDLAKVSLRDTLSRHPAFEPHRPTLFIAEGLLMYLPAEAVETMLHTLRGLCSSPVHVVFSAMEPEKQPKEGWGGKVRKTVLNTSEENFSWNMPQSLMTEFLKQFRFHQHYLLSYAELQRSWRTKEEMRKIENLKGEYLVYATGA